MVITQHAINTLSDPPAEGIPVLGEEPLESFVLAGGKKELGAIEVVPVTGQPFDRALRITTRSDPGSEWHIQAITRTTDAVSIGDVLLAKFWLRCVDSMTGEAYTGFVFEQAGPPFEKAAELRVGAGGNWIQCFVPFRATREFPAGEAQICFRAGFDRQTIEIAGIEVVNYGHKLQIESLPRTRVSYAGREPEAALRKEALQRIERIRKGDLSIRVTDAQGQPISGATVRATLKRHAFGFGSCVTADQITGDSPDDQRCRQIIERYFNRVVFENDMKWYAMWEGAAPKVDVAVDWLLERHIEIRGHNLLWPSWHWSPKQLRAFEKDPAEIRRRAAERVTSAVEHFKGKVIHWDVVNEPYNNHDLLDILGKDAMVDWFNLARKADPDCRLYLNDFGIFDGPPASEHRRHFFETIAWLRGQGAPIDGIGIQSHFGAVMPPPTQLLEVLDQFSQFGLPIESTEFSLNNEDRLFQADFMRDYMIAVFSHPMTQGIMLWGFWEGRHWRPHGALWSKEWTLRPHGQVWIDLITKQWHTDATMATNSSGNTSVRGFIGEYDITVSNGKKTTTAKANLSHDSKRIDVIL